MIPMADHMTQVHSDIRGPLFLRALEIQQQGEKVLKLNTGNPAAFGFTMPQSVRDALVANVDQAVAYCDFRGMPAARQAIINYQTGVKGIRGIRPEDVFIGNGVSELITMCTQALLNPGDEMLLPSPSYSLWSNSVYLAGAKPVFYRCDEQSDWFPDVADMRAKVTPRTRAILLINPNNPTGAVYPRELLSEIATLAKEKHLMVFSDEIYDRLLIGDVKHVSIASLVEDVPMVTLNGLSKSHSVCGFRCGWMVISGPYRETADFSSAMVKLASMRLCGNALAQLVIPAALADNESTQAMVRPGGRLYEQRKVILDGLSQIPGVSCVPNRAAFYIFPRVDAKRFHVTDDRELMGDLLEKKHILMVPGSGFDFPTPDHFRIVMLPAVEECVTAMADLKDFFAGRENL